MFEKIKITQAQEYLKEKGFDVTRPTIINWIKKYNIGIRIGGIWYTSIEYLEKMINGEITKPVTTKFDVNR